MPETNDAGLLFIGHIVTPWTSRADCPRQGQFDGPLCEIVLHSIWLEALAGIDTYSHLQILYWMHEARRDLVTLAPKGTDRRDGPFARRAPARPNPIASSIVSFIGREQNVLRVKGLDCVSGTPLLDIKPHRGPV